jgi:hypothetical protein
MIDKAARIEGVKTQKYTFEYENKNYEYEIQEPNFDQLAAALGQVKTDGRTDMIGAGKVIWELCCVAHDKEIEATPRLLMSICIELANNYALPIDIEIKKK